MSVRMYPERVINLDGRGNCQSECGQNDSGAEGPIEKKGEEAKANGVLDPLFSLSGLP